MEPEPPELELLFAYSEFILFSFALLVPLVILILLLLASAMMSGSEVAFFSLKRTDTDELSNENSLAADRIIALQEKPKRLLATILIANNFVNIAVVIVSALLINLYIGSENFDAWGDQLSAYIPMAAKTISGVLDFLITIFLATFLLVLFGEVAPKIYANTNNVKFAKWMSRPLSILTWLLKPITKFMVKWSSGFESKVGKINLQSVGKEELDKAIELTVSQEIESEDEVDILRGILKFGNTTTKQIMKSRVDVVGLDMNTEYSEVLKLIKEHGYSRIPVYSEDFDNIQGLLYVKDLIGFINKDHNVNWQRFIRKDVLYVPESKNIDELLKDFQLKRLHMAIVVDEFGGSAGIVTLEDIMEEVIGDIKDEFDEHEEVEYKKIDDKNYIFEGKTLLNDVARLINEEIEVFDAVKGQADSLAGLVLELAGEIPEKGGEYGFDRFKYKVLSVNRRRIEQIHLTILHTADESEV